MKDTRELLQASKQWKSNMAHLPGIQEKYGITLLWGELWPDLVSVRRSVRVVT